MRPRFEIIDSLMFELASGPGPTFVEKQRFASIDALPSGDGARRQKPGMLFRLNQRAFAGHMTYLETALSRFEDSRALELTARYVR